MHTCPYCKSNNVEALKVKREMLIPAPLDKEYRHVNGAFATIRPVLCKDCNLCFNAQEYDQEALDLTCAFGYIKPTDNIGQDHYNKILDLIFKFVKKDDAVIEIGSKTGRLLQLMENAGYSNLTGYDPGAEFESSEHITCIKECFTTNLKDLKRQDCFISQNSLGFFNDLHDFFGFIHQKLNDGGYFIIENVRGHVPLAMQFWFLHMACYESIARDNGFNIVFAKDSEELDGYLHVVLQKRAQGQSYVPYFDDAKLKAMTLNFVQDINRDYLDAEHTDALNTILKTHDEIILWGTGSSAFRILDCADSSLLKNAKFFVVDSDASRKGKYFVSPANVAYEVHHISDLASCNSKALIIGSSSEYAAEIKNAALKLKKDLENIFCVL